MVILLQRSEREFEVIFKCVQAIKDSVVKTLLAQLIPNMLDGIQFGRIRWQGQQPDVGRRTELATGMRTGTIEDHYDALSWVTLTNLIAKHLHTGCVDMRQDQRIEFTGAYVHCRVGVGVLVSEHSLAHGSYGLWRPATAHVVDAPKASLVLEYHLDRPRRDPVGVDLGEPLGQFFPLRLSLLIALWVALVGCKFAPAVAMQRVVHGRQRHGTPQCGLQLCLDLADHQGVAAARTLQLLGPSCWSCHVRFSVESTWHYCSNGIEMESNDMNNDNQPSDPRWGQLDRDKKAEAILRTVELAVPDRDVQQGTWLDIGCGSGGIAATLAQHVERVIGVDPESWQRWEPYQREHVNLTLRQGSYCDLPSLLADEPVDFMVCNQVYEHVDDPVALLHAIHRVMKPDGLCYFAGPNLLWPVEPHVFWPFVHWLPRGFAQWLMRSLGSKRADDLDAWLWPYWRLVRLFRDTGFQYASAIHERLLAGLSDDTPSLAHRLATHVPTSVVSALTPVSPGFVFMLTAAPASK